jgi:hypothetical protein
MMDLMPNTLNESITLEDRPMSNSRPVGNRLLLLLLCLVPALACQATGESSGPGQRLAQPAAIRVAAASSEAKLTISSTYGALLDNPVTKAVLAKLAAEVVNNPQSQMGRDLAFKDLAQFEPTLTPEKLKEIDAALAKAQES